MFRPSSMVSWYRGDTAYHTYIYSQLLIALPFAVFTTYTTYQLQIVGYTIGTNNEGGPCTDYCIVEWAGTRLDLNSVLLYMNAFGTALSGIVTLFLSAYSDYWAYKHLLITILFVVYGVICIPVFWLQHLNSSNFQALSGLSIVFTIATNILVALLNIYIPFCMRNNAAKNPLQIQEDEEDSKNRSFGFRMAVLGALANASGALLMYIIVIIITETTTAVQYPGLLITTVVGFITVTGSILIYYGLPKIPAKAIAGLKVAWSEPLIEFFRPFTDLLQRRSMAVLLFSYTIYNDSTYAIASVLGQLYVAEIRPATLEYTLYALASCISGVICAIGFLWARPYIPIRLETWLLIGYGINVLVPAWGCLGLAAVDFGFRSRWEFYVQVFLGTLSGTISNTAFRVLFSEMVPAANEVRWFGLQFVVSSATVWVNYVASAPLQNATHQLRFPLVLSLIFMVLAFATELARNVFPVFRRDQKTWALVDRRQETDVEDDQTSILSDDRYLISADAIVEREYPSG